MQTQIQTTEPEMTEDVFVQEERALAKLRRLESELGDREADAERSRITFEREPTEQGVTAQAVASQKAANARRDLEAAREEARPTIDAAVAKRQTNELASTDRELAQCEADLAEEVDAIRAMVDDHAQKLLAALESLHEHTTERNNLAKRAETLSHAANGSRSRLSVGYFVTEKLNPAFAKKWGNENSRRLDIGFVPSANGTYFTLEFNHPHPYAWTDRRP